MKMNTSANVFVNHNFNVEVLVNGNSVAKYIKDGKVFIEAKNDSEYEIKINNNTWQRVLAVASVDGLNVLTGEPAGPSDSGYVISGYNTIKIKGFRYNDDSVGAFKFVSKGKSYSKGQTGTTTNCGIIGVQIIAEKIKEPEYVKYCNTTITTTGADDGVLDWMSPAEYSRSSGELRGMNFCSADLSSKGASPDITSQRRVNVDKLSSSPIKKTNFDMGSTWGNKKESKVTTVTFERDTLVLASFDIYYASREALLEMGVIEDSKPKVSFPESFPKKYATPPAGWP